MGVKCDLHLYADSIIATTLIFQELDNLLSGFLFEIVSSSKFKPFLFSVILSIRDISQTFVDCSVYELFIVKCCVLLEDFASETDLTC